MTEKEIEALRGLLQTANFYFTVWFSIQLEGGIFTKERVLTEKRIEEILDKPHIGVNIRISFI